MSTKGTEASEQRVIARGQWLGTQNRIASLRWTKRLGWVARDSTGEEYSQFRSPKGSLIVYCPAGLMTFASPKDWRLDAERTPWPSKPDPSGSEPT